MAGSGPGGGPGGSGDGPRSRPQREWQSVLRRLRRDAVVLATAFHLPLRSVEAERANVKRRFGVCYDDGSIRIRLRHLRTHELLKYSALVDTLCHELAHLRYFDHAPRFHALYRGILGHARRRGIYTPALRGAPRGTCPAGRPLAGEAGLALRQSSILPLARLGPRQPRPRPRQEGPRPGRAGAQEGAAQGQGPGGRRRFRPEQLELFR